MNIFRGLAVVRLQKRRAAPHSKTLARVLGGFTVQMNW